MLRFQQQAPPATEEQICQFEQTIKSSLPCDYRRFLMEQCGGWLDDFGEIMNVDDCGDAVSSGLSVNHLFSIEFPDGDACTLIWNYECFLGRIPDETIAIGSDVGGNQYLLGIRGPQTGKVYLWHHDMEGFEERRDRFEITQELFSSFKELIESLAGFKA